MKKNSYLVMILIVLIAINLIGCSIEEIQEGSPEESKEEPHETLQQIEEIQGFDSINGYRVEEGKFYFTGIKNNQWNLYRLDLESEDLQSIHPGAENYDLYIALNEKDAVYIDLEGQLFYRIGEREKKISQQVRGIQRPNLLLSPNKDAILYTEGTLESADFYVYFFHQEEPILIKRNIAEDAFRTFSFTTKWSSKNNYFIYYNQEIYDNKGELHTTIDATTALWSPDDQYIVFIKTPKRDEREKIAIGNWNTYIGKELCLLFVVEKREKIIYENTNGLIEPMENLQWSKDASKTAVSVGEIIIAPHGELERLNYEKIFVYDISTEESIEVENMPYNYYEILFDNYLYASSLGKREVLELVEIYREERIKYENPTILNSRDMFVISSQKESYFLDGKKLISFNAVGEEEVLLQLPWEANEIYLDTETNIFIIISKEMKMYLFKP